MGIGSRLLALSLAGALVAPMMAAASVYRCTVDGATVFSDRPCGGQSEQVEVRSAPMVGGNMGAAGSREFLEHRDTKRNIESIDRRISELERQRNRAQADMDRALIRWQQNRARANNNLAGATWEGSLAQEAEVLRQRYQSEIDGVNAELRQLRNDRRELMNRNQTD